MNIKNKTLTYVGISLLIIVGLIIGSLTGFIIFNKTSSDNNPKDMEISEKLAICIGKNSIYYGQTGCSACKTQENLFGENFKHINHIDCRRDMQICVEAGISATPTWIINNQQHVGVQSIEKLKELTKC